MYRIVWLLITRARVCCVVCLGVLQFLYRTMGREHLYRAVCGRVTLGNLCGVRRKGYSFEWSYRLRRERERELGVCFTFWERKMIVISFSKMFWLMRRKEALGIN